MTKNTIVGLTGWLTPEGKFIKCKYGYHSEVAIKLIKKEQELNQKRIIAGIINEERALREFLFIPMGSKGDGYENCSHIMIPTKGKFTEAQIKWLKKNYLKLDENQREYLDEFGKIAGWTKDNP
jgi:uncharacterized protein YifN (PemK superfamily)